MTLLTRYLRLPRNIFIVFDIFVYNHLSYDINQTRKGGWDAI